MDTHPPNVSPFYVRLVARNPKDEDRATGPIQVLVDTGSELSWLPRNVLEQIGLVPRRRCSFETATGELVSRDVGYAILAAEGFETNDEIVFAEPGDAHLLGVRTIEGFGVTVDNIGHRFVARPMLAV